jgi:peptide/nickel transport system ATP-binding protein/oligopeptide transport system ATP-binding protein
MGRLLEIKNISTRFETDRGIIRAVDGVDIALNHGETIGIVGESGCGKTVLALSIMRLIPSPPGRIIPGNIYFNGVDLLSLDKENMRKIRGRDISMIFQEPMTSLNPVLQIGEQISEIIRLHKGLGNREALEKAIEALQLVGMPSPERIVGNYPHQLSGGMRQRVMIAMALCCGPKLMLADEPTTALDVTIQAQIIDLISKSKEDIGTSVILITHDLGIVAEAAQFVAVMYTGKIVEYASVNSIFNTPLHPYTVGLMDSIPSLKHADDRNQYLKVIPGMVPSLYELPEGCSFQDRCSQVMKICRESEPQLLDKSAGHMVRCWLYE